MTGTAFVGLEAYLAAEVERVEAALERALERLAAGVAAPDGSAGPGRAAPPPSLDGSAGPSAPPALDAPVLAAIRHGLLGGGKRLRPVLCVAAYRAARTSPEGTAAEGAAVDAPGDPPGSATGPEAVYDLAASLEMIHAYSLMHDDLPCMDDGELRRGRPTTHRVHGEQTTMLAGAALIPAAALQALHACARLGCGPGRARGVARHLMRASGAGGMVGGQWLDLLGEGRALGAEELGDLHSRKTGALLAASPVVGAMAAGAPDEATDALGAYGRAIGLAFQITDDVLDATASAEALGKNPSDADLEKSTYVALYGLDGARARADAQIDGALAALRGAGIESAPLEALARYVVERGR